MNTRPSTLEFKKIDAKRGAEIGVCKAENAFTILTELPEVTLIGVDNNALQYNNVAKDILSSFNGRFIFHEMTSVDASKLVEDGSLDFVYIDADHMPVNVLADLNHWYPKVRKGGIVAGHDFEKLGRIDNQDVQNTVLQFVPAICY